MTLQISHQSEFFDVYVVTTGGTDATAPTLSAQTVVSITSQGGKPQVTTDEDNGTLYMVVVPNLDVPSVAQIKAGQQSDSSPALANESIVVFTAGVQTGFAQVTGLSASTDYDVWFVHTDVATNDSTPVKADFTTLAAGAGVYLSFSSSIASQYLMMGWI